MSAKKQLKYLLISAGLVSGLLFTSGVTALAQDKTPPLPAPVEELVNSGAQIRYLGRELGLDGWIAILGGREQIFYVTQEGDALLSGHLFDKNGKSVTLRQIRALQEKNGADTLDLFASETSEDGAGNVMENQARETNKEFKTPSEQLFADVSASNWVALGDQDAPAIYTFIDPQCPYCHDFMKDLKSDYIDSGRVQVRMIPVGFRAETLAQAAFLLAVPNPQKRWYRHLDGDEDALPVTQDINKQGVQRNLAIMQSWKLNVTPLTVYRNAQGDVKIIQGRAKDIPGMIQDIAG